MSLWIWSSKTVGLITILLPPSRFDIRYADMPAPPNTPTSLSVPGPRPAFSNACHTVSRNNRCWGSSSAASRALTLKNDASNRSTPSNTEAARTYSGRENTSRGTPSANSSSSLSGATDSTPPRRLRQKASRSGAPGNRPAMPTTATLPADDSTVS